MVTRTERLTQEEISKLSTEKTQMIIGVVFVTIFTLVGGLMASNFVGALFDDKQAIPLLLSASIFAIVFIGVIGYAFYHLINGFKNVNQDLSNGVKTVYKGILESKETVVKRTSSSSGGGGKGRVRSGSSRRSSSSTTTSHYFYMNGKKFDCTDFNKMAVKGDLIEINVAPLSEVVVSVIRLAGTR